MVKEQRNSEMSIDLEHSLAPFRQNRVKYGYFSKLPKELLLLISTYYFGPIELSMACITPANTQTIFHSSIKVFTPDGILQSICRLYLNPYELLKGYQQWPKGFTHRLSKSDDRLSKSDDRLSKSDDRIEIDNNFYTDRNSYICYHTIPKHQLEISLSERNSYTWIILNEYSTKLFWEKLKRIIDTIGKNPLLSTANITDINFHEFVF
jgi:hypothetical protein